MPRSRRTNQSTSLTETAELLRLLDEALEDCDHADRRAVLAMALVDAYPESGAETREQARERAAAAFAAISPVITAPLDRNALRFITDPAVANAMNPEVASVLTTDNSLVSEFVKRLFVNPDSISSYEIYKQCAGVSNAIVHLVEMPSFIARSLLEEAGWPGGQVTIYDVEDALSLLDGVNFTESLTRIDQEPSENKVLLGVLLDDAVDSGLSAARVTTLFSAYARCDGIKAFQGYLSDSIAAPDAPLEWIESLNMGE